MHSPELIAKLSLYRQKVVDKTITDDELKDAVAILRQERHSALETSLKRRKAAKAATRSADDLLRELDNL